MAGPLGNGQRGFSIQGQGLRKSQEVHFGHHEAEGACSAEPLSSASDIFLSMDHSDDQGLIVGQLIGLNRTLEQQIETLRMRLEFDHKHHRASRAAVEAQTNVKLQTKEKEIETLKMAIQRKESDLDTIGLDNKNKSGEIVQLQRQIDDLTCDVDFAKTYALDLQKEIAQLQETNNRLESGQAQQDKENEIRLLKQEVNNLQSNLSKLERELSKAKGIIGSQGNKIRLLENDGKNMQIKFKEELSKVSQIMRFEIEKMRDVMTCQWEEMKSLREQNESMSRDIREIRDLLVGSQMTDDSKEQDIKRPSHNPLYSTNYINVLKPSLPALTKDTRRILPGKKKGF